MQVKTNENASKWSACRASKGGGKVGVEAGVRLQSGAVQMEIRLAPGASLPDKT